MITNITRKKILSKTFIPCTSIFSKTKGLMFKSQVTKPLIFIFSKEKIIPLHMWFVFCTIDVLWLDQNKKIVELHENFKPFTFYTPKKKAKYVVELKNGSIQKSGTNKDDTLQF